MASDPHGTTALDDEERDALIPDHITTREQLNAWEHTNIEQAELWVFARKKTRLLTLEFVRKLHYRMFDETWTWAGEFRKSEKNIGVLPQTILMDVRNACDDAQYWIANATFPLPEVAARYHHRLVQIHPFPNGNGRHARLSADVVLVNHGHRRLKWRTLDTEGEDRRQYIVALKAADAGSFAPLLEYLRLAAGPPPR